MATESVSMDPQSGVENQDLPSDSPENGGELLAGKYQTEEELQKGILEKIKQDYGDLESYYKTLESGKASGESSSEDTSDSEDTSSDSDTGEEDAPSNREEAADLLSQNGLDMSTFEQEFAENGELSQESYDQLTQYFPKNVVDTYIEGQKALATQYAQSIYQEAGDQDTYSQMVEWAAENLSQEEIDYFNEAVQSGDTVKAKYAVRALKSQFDANSSKDSSGNNLNLAQAGTTGRRGASGYSSKQEMVRDMQDPKYQNDPGFRSAVDAKLRQTPDGVM